MQSGGNSFRATRNWPVSPFTSTADEFACWVLFQTAFESPTPTFRYIRPSRQRPLYDCRDSNGQELSFDSRAALLHNRASSIYKEKSTEPVFPPLRFSMSSRSVIFATAR